ncbi:hypothetical protein JCM3765_002261 [Sporobolomyces pararoseus]
MSNLLPLPFKRTEPVNLSTSLISYITNSSSTTGSIHPSLIKTDCEKLDQLRKEIYGQNGEILIMNSSVDKLLTYQAQLSLTLNKFPDNAGPCFIYYPIFPSPSSTSSFPPGSLPSSSSSSQQTQPPKGIPSLSYEYLSTLYNLTSLYTHLALSNQNQRSSTSGDGNGESLKKSINYLQSSLGTLQKIIYFLPTHLKNLEKNGIRYHLEREGNRDFNNEEGVLKGFESFLKSLIQEFGWKKSVLDRLKNGTISKLSYQVSIFYKESLDYFPIDYLPIEWKVFLKLKQTHFDAVSQYRRSIDDLGSNRYGDEIGRLNYSIEILQSEINKVPSRIVLKGSVLESVLKDSKKFLKVLQENFKRANKDNDLIYLSTPTPFSSLPPITPFPLTRSTPPPPITNPRDYLREKDKVFEMMDRKEVLEILEIWKDRKFNWLRDKEKWVRDEDEIVRMTLESLNLPASLEEEEEPEQEQEQPDTSSSKKKKLVSYSIPQSLLDQSQEIVNLGGLKRLETLFRDVRKLSQFNRELLNETNQYLQQQQPHHPTSSSTSNEHANQLLERLSYFSQLLNQATDSDQLVRSKFSIVEKNISILEQGRDLILSHLPPPQQQQPEPETLPTKNRGKRRTQEDLIKFRKFKRSIKSCLEEIEQIKFERNELVFERINQVVLQNWGIRDKVILKSNQLSTQAQSQQVDHDHEEGGGIGLEMFEKVLIEEMNRIEKIFKPDLNRLEMEQKNLIDQLKTLNTQFQSLKTPPPPLPSSSPSSSNTQQLDSTTTTHTTTTLTARQEQLESFSLAHSKFIEILNNLKEGLKFYDDLNKLVCELRDLSKQFAYSRSIEQQQQQQHHSEEEEAHQQTIPLEEEEEEEAEEEEPIIFEDPISQKLSEPIISLQTRTTKQKVHPPSPSSSADTKETPRRSSRRTTTANATTTSSKKREGSSRKFEPETPEEESTSSRVRAGGGGGWDPSMGIRFG